MGSAKRLADNVVQPSYHYFPSHMSQTQNSVRRAVKGSQVKNQQLYAQEEEAKALIRKIKQKRT